MVACIEPALGMFFRINSRPNWQTPVHISQLDHPFLKRDSSLECGEPIELDDFVIEESLDDKGVIGVIHENHAVEIFAAVRQARTISPKDKELIRIALGVAP